MEPSTMEPSTIPLRLVGRLGAGDKLHPLVEHPRYGVWFTCSCPGTQNGHARLTWKGLGTPTCTRPRRR
jgi:hypothetical protein